MENIITAKEAKYLEQKARRINPIERVFKKITERSKEGNSFVKFNEYSETTEFWAVEHNKNKLQSLGYTLEIVGNSYYIKW